MGERLAEALALVFSPTLNEDLLGRGSSLTGRRHLVHDVRQQLIHHGSELAGVDAELGGGLIQGVRMKNAFQLIG
jgi:hypothetical protein